jgi:hypothetical protein
MLRDYMHGVPGGCCGMRRRENLAFMIMALILRGFVGCVKTFFDCSDGIVFGRIRHVCHFFDLKAGPAVLTAKQTVERNAPRIAICRLQSITNDAIRANVPVQEFCIAAANVFFAVTAAHAVSCQILS